MSSRQAVFDELSDSVMYRTMQGTINFWNRCAEELYGWRQEEAVGRVSHDLLQTQFPKPLSEIESELLANGKWEGKLVHATRDGSRVVVRSRWILDQNGQPAEIVEINTRFTTDCIDPTDGSDTATGKQDAVARVRSAKPILNRWLVVGLLSIGALWIVYALFGRLLMRALYASNFAIADRFMAGRAFTPVENYYWRADQLLWSGTILILAICAVGWLAMRSLGGAILAVLSLTLSSLVLFGALELFPSLIKTLHLEVISPYHAYKANYIYDEQLLFKEKPFNQSVTVGFKGANYSPIYGIDVAPITIDWRADENGFRNSRKTDFADLVVIGDSYMDYGADESNTFPKILQEQLPGLTVMNLAKSGYGPFQYLEVLKRFGLKYKPRYAIFAFYGGNDILDIQNYLDWKAGKLQTYGDLTYIAAQNSFLRRYWLALRTIANQANAAALVMIQMVLDENPLLGEEKYKIHPDLAVVDLGNGKQHKIHIADSTTRLQEAMSVQENWVALERILREFKDLCATHQIMPIVLYIPSPSHVYAQFTTRESGGNWLLIREREIAARKDAENAVGRLVHSAGIRLHQSEPGA